MAPTWDTHHMERSESVTRDALHRPGPATRRPCRLTAAAAIVLLMALPLLPIPAPSALANHGSRTLDVIPDVQESAVNGPVGITAQLSTAPDAGSPISIDFEMISGPNNDDGDTTSSPDFTCTISDPSTSCATTYFGTGGSGTDRIRAWIDHDQGSGFDGDAAEGRDEVDNPGDDDEPDVTDVVEIVWNAGPVTVVKNLDCEPETSTQKPASGTNAGQDFTCTATAPVPSGSPPGTVGDPVPGVRIDGESLSGANDPDDSSGGSGAMTADYDDACTTASDGTCVLRIVPTEGESGTANICFWADYPGTNDQYTPQGINSDDGGDCDNEGQGQSDNDRTDTVQARWLAITDLTLAPGSETGPVGTQMSVAATLRISQSDQTTVPGVPVIFSAGPANDVVDSATTDGSGVAPFAYTGTHTGQDTITAFADLNDNSIQDGSEPSATATKTWGPQAAARVDCMPETASRPAAPLAASEQSFTCAVSDQFGNPVTATTEIDAELYGPNDPDDTAAAGTADFDNFCTATAGTCSGTVSAPEKQAGMTLVCFWADSTTPDAAFDPAGAVTDGGGCVGEGADGPEDNPTDVVLMTWTPGAPTQLDCSPDDVANPPSGPGSDETFTCEIRDANGNFVDPGIRVDAESLAGANDPDHSDGRGESGAANTTPDWDNVCVTGPGGACTATIPTAGEIGTALVCFWIDPASSTDNRFNISGAEADGGSCDNDPIPPAADNSNATDVVRETWEARVPSALALSPEEGTQPIGSGHAVTATLTDQFGGPYPNVTVNFAVAGTTGASGSGKTSSSGAAVLSYASGTTGTDTIEAYADLNANGAKDAGEPAGTATTIWVDPTPAGGYWLVANDGGIFAYGTAGFHGSTGNLKLAKPIVSMAPTPSGKGYWLVASDGGIFAYGDAVFHGSTGNLKLAQPIVGMAPTASGNGYWLVAADGGVFAYGDAVFHGSTGNIKLAKPIVGLETTSSGNGYWMVASDGGVFAFGDAKFHGSTGGLKLAKPIVGMTRTPTSNGYWIVASDGGIFAFGDATFHGSTGNVKLAQPIVSMASTLTGKGYWLVASDGGIFAFGDATFHGSTGNTKLAKPIVGMASRR